jgi:hypothetical protein
MLNIVMLSECHYAECQCAECRYAECHFVECSYAECSEGPLKGNSLNLQFFHFLTLPNFFNIPQNCFNFFKSFGSIQNPTRPSES